MENQGIFGLSESFIDSLTSDELQELQSARNIIDKYGERYRTFEGAPSKDDMKQHLLEVAEADRKQRADQERLTRSFR